MGDNPDNCTHYFLFIIQLSGLSPIQWLFFVYHTII
jgi:hypothetical protein